MSDEAQEPLTPTGPFLIKKYMKLALEQARAFAARDREVAHRRKYSAMERLLPFSHHNTAVIDNDPLHADFAIRGFS